MILSSPDVGALMRRVITRGPKVAIARVKAMMVNRSLKPSKVPGVVRSLDVLKPCQVSAHNVERLARVFESKQIDWWIIDAEVGQQVRVGVARSDFRKLMAALAQSNERFLVRDPENAHFTVRSDRLFQSRTLHQCRVIQIWGEYSSRNFHYGVNYSVSVELWNEVRSEGENGLAWIQAPLENRASLRILKSDFSKRTDYVVSNRVYQSLDIIKKPDIEDIRFPVDAVYTWVDDTDLHWQQEKTQYASQYRHIVHSESLSTARFKNRDELKYSLRSLEMYMPWIRKVYIVTNGQVPSWFTSTERYVIVRHEDIFEDSDHLPTFNSNSIISRLHHIPNLSEHFIYFNDDVMLTSIAKPDDYFTAGGIARTFSSTVSRDMAPLQEDDLPHVAITKNIRSLIEKDFGVTVRRAAKHTPRPLLRSVSFELEQKYSEWFKRTAESKFRSNGDIAADQLQHYYLQIVGKGVQSPYDYLYINLGDTKSAKNFHKILPGTDRKAVCFNDVPSNSCSPVGDDEVRVMLERLYPFPSQAESS